MQVVSMKLHKNQNSAYKFLLVSCHPCMAISYKPKQLGNKSSNHAKMLLSLAECHKHSTLVNDYINI